MHASSQTTRRALHLLTAVGAMTVTLTFAGQAAAQAAPGDPPPSWDGDRRDGGDRPQWDRDDAPAPAPEEAPPPAPEPAPEPEPEPEPAPEPEPEPEPTGTGEDAYKDYAEGQVSNATQFDCLEDLWEAESSWNPDAQNPTSTAYGIAQFLDSTWAGTGIAKTSDPFRQIDAGLIYIDERYGTSCAAWSFHQANNWY